MSKAFVVGAGVMGAAVVAAAGFTILVFAGLFDRFVREWAEATAR